MPGVIEVTSDASIGRVIEGILLILNNQSSTSACESVFMPL